MLDLVAIVLLDFQSGTISVRRRRLALGHAFAAITPWIYARL
ncbi:hypothetical protein OHS59_28570 [Streptomyces sp. NBC_00414]